MYTSAVAHVLSTGYGRVTFRVKKGLRMCHSGPEMSNEIDDTYLKKSKNRMNQKLCSIK